MAHETDRRVRRTRAALRHALESLMQQKSIQTITVRELCEASDINRGTFYLHYADVNALLHAVEAELLAEFEQVLAPLTEGSAFSPDIPSLEAMFEFLARNADMCRVLLCNNGDMAFLERVTGIVRERLLVQMGMVLPQSGAIAPGYAIAFMVSGCIGLLQQWLTQDMPAPPKEIAALVENILARGISALR